MDDALEADHGEEPGAETCQPGQEQDGEGQEGLPAGRLRQSSGQASSAPAAAASRAVGSAVARDGAPRARARFVLAVGGGVLLRHVLDSLGQEGSQLQLSHSLCLPQRLPLRSWSLPVPVHSVFLRRIIYRQLRLGAAC